MKNRLNLLLGALLVIQLFVIFVFDKPWSSGYTRLAPKNKKEALLFPDFIAEKAASFTVTRGEQTITLVRKGPNEWAVKEPDREYKADIEWVEILLDSLGRAKKSDVVSNKPANWDHYEVDEEKGFHLTVTDDEGKIPVDVIVGKTMGPLKGTFVRMAGSNDVMLIMENIRRGVNKGKNWLRAWRDRMIHKEKRKKNIASLKIEGEHGTIVIEHRLGKEGEEDKWLLAEPITGEAALDSINMMMATLCSLKAMGFMPPGTKLADVGLDPPQLVLTLNKNDGSSVVFKVSKAGAYKGKKGLRCLTASNHPGEIFKVSASFFLYFSFKPEAYLKKTGGGDSGEGSVQEEGASSPAGGGSQRM